MTNSFKQAFLRQQLAQELKDIRIWIHCEVDYVDDMEDAIEYHVANCEKILKEMKE